MSALAVEPLAGALVAPVSELLLSMADDEAVSRALGLGGG